MAEKDFEVICAKIDEEKEFLNSISQEIWKMPELMYKEVQAHAILTCALRKQGFQVQKHYFMPTAFRAEFCPEKDSGSTVAILLEYDALPDIGHGCGHNLIAEAGLGAAMGIKAAMEADSTLLGKVVVLGTPAEEGGGGKIRLLELGALDGVDIALMVHPGPRTLYFPIHLCTLTYKVDFKGKEAHASVSPWEGCNALDAAVSCYQSIALLRQQIKTSHRIHAIITKGGTAVNVIPAESQMVVLLRAPTKGELTKLQTRVEACFVNAALATSCKVQFRYDEDSRYENVITNKTLATLFKTYAEKKGLKEALRRPQISAGSTDMGNVSHKVPSIHCIYGINTTAFNHTKEFTVAAGSESAQEPTLAASAAMAMTAVVVLRCPKTLEEIKRQFEADVLEDEQSEALY